MLSGVDEPSLRVTNGSPGFYSSYLGNMGHSYSAAYLMQLSYFFTYGKRAGTCGGSILPFKQRWWYLKILATSYDRFDMAPKWCRAGL